MESLQFENQLAFEVVKTCRLCGSSDLVSSLRLRDTPFGDRYLPPGKGAANANLIPLEVVQCVSCNGFQT
ncbi:MAG: hypothetical protein WCH63_10595, partial [Actinomycetota bacterium]